MRINHIKDLQALKVGLGINECTSLGYGQTVVALTNARAGIDIEVHVISKGLTRTVMRTTFDIIFNKLGYQRCSAIVDNQNTKIIKLLPRLGFQKEANLINTTWSLWAITPDNKWSRKNG